METNLKAIINIDEKSHFIYHTVDQWRNLNYVELPILLGERDFISYLKVIDNQLNVELTIPLGKMDLPDEELTKAAKWFNWTKSETRLYFEKLLYVEEFEVRLHDIFLALQIAAPAEVNFVKMDIFQDGELVKNKFHDQLVTPEFALCGVEDYDSMINTVEFIKVWQWLRLVKDFWMETPNSKTGVLLNYFRYFYYDKPPLAILWLVMALEAILVTNQSFSKNQIVGKLSVLLNNKLTQEKIKDLVEELYNLRSKIVHGKQRLFRPTMLNDGLSNVVELYCKIANNGAFAYAAVINCIHYMVLHNVQNLNFTEKLVYELL